MVAATPRPGECVASGLNESWPAITLRIRAASSTVLAIGPRWSRVHERYKAPLVLTRPKVGLNPTMPHKVEGTRMEPAVSLPMAARHM